MKEKQKVTVVGDMLLAYTDKPRDKWLTRKPAGHDWYNPGGIYYTRYENKKLKSTATWENMQIRCTRFGKTIRIERSKSYAERDAVPLFKNYQTYCEWFREQVESGAYQQGFELDHNLLFPGNKIYSPETCIFIPMQINRVIVDNPANNTGFSGVQQLRQGVFSAVIIVNGKKKWLGTFSCAESASAAYTSAKLEYVHELADLWKDKISQRVYDAIIQWRPYDLRN